MGQYTISGLKKNPRSVWSLCTIDGESSTFKMRIDNPFNISRHESH